MVWKLLQQILLALGLLEGKGQVINVRITRPANATGYTANDVLNDTGASMLELKNVVRKPGAASTSKALR